MIVAAHQPHFLPWLGYLDKLAKADLFVVMDDLQYEAQNFQNRNRIKLDTGAAWLTVPVERGAQTDRICDKRITNTASPKEHWQRRSWLTLKTHYGRAPHFGAYAAAFEDIYARRWDWLLDLDLHILDLVRRWFGITRPIVRSSSLGLVVKPPGFSFVASGESGQDRRCPWPLIANANGQVIVLRDVVWHLRSR